MLSERFWYFQQKGKRKTLQARLDALSQWIYFSFHVKMTKILSGKSLHKSLDSLGGKFQLLQPMFFSSFLAFLSKSTETWKKLNTEWSEKCHKYLNKLFMNAARMKGTHLCSFTVIMWRRVEWREGKQRKKNRNSEWTPACVLTCKWTYEEHQLMLSPSKVSDSCKINLNSL